MIRRAFPFLALLAFGAAASSPTSAQVLGPVQHLPGDETPAPAAFDQQAPYVVRGGDQYLVVWVDHRTDNEDNLVSDEGGADIYAARLDLDGTLLDPIPILLSAEAGDESQPEIAWNGTNWLVTWVIQKQTEFFYADAIRAVRVSPAGQILDAQPIAVFDYSSSSGIEYAVTSDGTNWAVAVRGTQGGDTDVKGIRIGPDGTVLNPGGTVLVAGDFTLTFGLNLVFAQDEYLLAYTHSSGVKYRLFSTTLAPLTNVLTITTSFSSLESPHAASNGTDFYVVWRVYTSTTQIAEVRGTRISHAGTVLDAGGDRIFQGSGGGDVPRVAWDGLYWFTTFRGSNTFDNGYRAARASAAGAVLDNNGVEVFDDHFALDPEIEAQPEGGVRVVYYDDVAGGPTPNDVFTRSIAQTLTASPPAVVPYSAPAQLAADVATSGAGSLVVYRREVSGQRAIHAHPLGADGDPLLPAPIVLDSGPTLGSPKVAWDGARYLVVWDDPEAPGDGDVFGQRLAADGTLLDAAPFFIMEGFGPDVAGNAGTFLVVDIQVTTTPEIQEPFAVRVDGATGAVLGTPRDIGTNHTRYVSVTGTGSRWLVSYQRNFSHDDNNAEVRANFVEADGTAGPEFTVASGLNPFLYQPEVAWNGADGLVVFYDSNSDTDEVLGARVFNDRTVGPLITVADAADEQNDPAVAWDGAQYVTLYEDLREATFFLDERSDVYGTRLSATGTVLDPAGFPVFNDPLSETDPAVAGSGGVALLLASDFRETPPYAAYRVGYRFLGDQPPPAPTLDVEVTITSGAPVPAAGGTVRYEVALTNTTAASQTTQYWVETTQPTGAVRTQGPYSTTVAAGATFRRTLSLRLTSRQRAGTYTLTGKVGTYPATVIDSDLATFEKLAAAATAEAEGSGLPTEYALEAPAPNPFRGQATLRYALPAASAVRLSVYDGLGRRVALLVDEEREAGYHTARLDASSLPSGTYVVRLEAGAYRESRTLTLLR